VYLLATFVGFAGFFFIFQYLQLVLGLSPLEAALWAVPSFAAFIVGSMLTPLIVRRVRPAYAMSAGLALAAAGYGLLTQVDKASGLGVLVTATVIFSLGEGPVFTLTNDLIIGAAPPERAGAAAGISETSSELGGALGIAVLGSMATALYRSQVADGIPAGVPREQADAARDTLGGAVAASHQLPAPLDGELLDAARDAFTQGLHVAGVTSAVISGTMAVLAAVLLRRAGAGPHQEGHAVSTSGEAVEAAQPS
jgi:DHA2 family multidrug resistance protein-like MFS transporter